MRNKRELYSSYQYREQYEKRLKRKRKKRRRLIKSLAVFGVIVGVFFGFKSYRKDLASKKSTDINLMGDGETNPIDIGSIPSQKLGSGKEVVSKADAEFTNIEVKRDPIMDDPRLVKRPRSEEDILNNLKVFAEKNKNADIIIEKYQEVPINLLRLAGNNYNAIDFVAKYIDPTTINEYEYPRHGYGSKVPLYIQWDDEWGHQKYGNGVLGYTGCAPTSVAMVVSALKNDPSIKPSQIAKMSDKRGFASDVGTSWDFYPYVADAYGMRVVQANPDYEVIKNNIENGNLIVISVGEGDFTFESHVMVIVGLDSNGNILIHDPNSFENSSKPWNYEDIGSQIRSMWIFSNGGAIE
ncbi:MAG: C39 family peptidase [Finegoldia sp.]|nr:C39 family peptidase [Finegoldia sp.]